MVYKLRYRYTVYIPPRSFQRPVSFSPTQFSTAGHISHGRRRGRSGPGSSWSCLRAIVAGPGRARGYTRPAPRRRGSPSVGGGPCSWPWASPSRIDQTRHAILTPWRWPHQWRWVVVPTDRARARRTGLRDRQGCQSAAALHRDVHDAGACKHPRAVPKRAKPKMTMMTRPRTM